MKKNVKVLLILICLFFITGCGLSAEERALKKEYEKEAPTIAEEYIQNKYGITAKVMNAKAETTASSLSTKTSGTVWVTMKYNNEKFNVRVECKEKHAALGDTYQEKEIHDAWTKEFENVFSSKIVDAQYVSGFDSIQIYKNKYDGMNLYDVVPNEIEISFINANFDDVEADLLNQYSDLFEKYYFYNYRSEEEYQEFMSSGEIIQDFDMASKTRSIYLKESIFKCDHCYGSNNNFIHEKFNIPKKDLVIVEDHYSNNYLNYDELKNYQTNPIKEEEYQDHISKNADILYNGITLTSNEPEKIKYIGIYIKNPNPKKGIKSSSNRYRIFVMGYRNGELSYTNTVHMSNVGHYVFAPVYFSANEIRLIIYKH